MQRISSLANIRMELRMEDMQTGLRALKKKKIKQWNCTKWRSSHTHASMNKNFWHYLLHFEWIVTGASLSLSLIHSVNCCVSTSWTVALRASVRVKDALDRARQKSLPLHDRCVLSVRLKCTGARPKCALSHSLNLNVSGRSFSIFISFMFWFWFLSLWPPACLVILCYVMRCDEWIVSVEQRCVCTN